MNQSPFIFLLRRITLMALLLAGAFTAAAQTEPDFTEKYIPYKGEKVPMCIWEKLQPAAIASVTDLILMKLMKPGTVVGSPVAIQFRWSRMPASKGGADGLWIHLIGSPDEMKYFFDTLEDFKYKVRLVFDGEEEILTLQDSVKFSRWPKNDDRALIDVVLCAMKVENVAPLLEHNLIRIVLRNGSEFVNVDLIIELGEKVKTAPAFAAMSKRLDVMLQAGIDEAGNAAAAEAAAAKKAETKQPESVVVDNPTVWPSYPGGMPALMRFVAQNLQYPAQAREQGVQGRVVVEFVVETDGRLTGCRVLRSVSPELDGEALRLLSIMPRWEPGSKDGQPVRVRYTYPIAFRLE